MGEEFDFNSWLKSEISSTSNQVKVNETRAARAKGEFTSTFTPVEPKTVYLNTRSVGKYKLSLIPTETSGVRMIPNVRKINLAYDVAKDLRVSSKVSTTEPEKYKGISDNTRVMIRSFNTLFDDFVKELDINAANNFINQSLAVKNNFGKSTIFSKTASWYIFAAKVLSAPSGVKALGDDEDLVKGKVYTFATKSPAFIKAYSTWIENLEDTGVDPRNILGRDIKERPNYVLFDFSQGQPTYMFNFNNATFKQENISQYAITDEELELTKSLNKHIVDIEPEDEAKLTDKLGSWIDYFSRVKELKIKSL